MKKVSTKSAKMFRQLMATVALVAGFASTSNATSVPIRGTFNRLCPQHIGGDREYGGHGPEVYVNVTLRRNSSRDKMELYTYMHQIETRADWSESEFERSFTLGSAPAGRQFSLIWAPGPTGSYQWTSLGSATEYDSYELFYVDTNHSLDRFFPSGAKWWLQEVAANGDTSGNDIGNCTADDAYLNVRLSTIYVWY